MKSIIVYDSASGFTKRYGEWISAELSADCRSLCDVDAQMLSQYDCVIFGSHVVFGDFSSRKKIARLSKGLKKVLVYVVGSAPQEHNPMIPALFARIDKSMPQFKDEPHFYFTGGVNHEALPKKDRNALRLMVGCMKLVNSIKPSPKLKMIIKMMSTDNDASSKEFIAPLVKYVNA